MAVGQRTANAPAGRGSPSLSAVRFTPLRLRVVTLKSLLMLSFTGVYIQCSLSLCCRSKSRRRKVALRLETDFSSTAPAQPRAAVIEVLSKLREEQAAERDALTKQIETLREVRHCDVCYD